MLREGDAENKKEVDDKQPEKEKTKTRSTTIEISVWGSVLSSARQPFKMNKSVYLVNNAMNIVYTLRCLKEELI